MSNPSGSPSASHVLPGSVDPAPVACGCSSAALYSETANPILAQATITGIRKARTVGYSRLSRVAPYKE